MHERHYRLFIPCLIGLADSASASGTRAALLELLGTIWNARRATGTEPQALLGTVFPLQGGVREGLFCRVVGLLERAEESCKGLKHGYYDLPCVHFLIFLCHSFKRTKFFNGLCPIKQIFFRIPPSPRSPLIAHYSKKDTCLLFRKRACA